MTPAAGQWATLQENGDPDPRAIVDGVSFDIKNQAVIWAVFLNPILYLG
jgi:hypothetical protein